MTFCSDGMSEFWQRFDERLAPLATKAEVSDCCHPKAVAALPQAAL
jgi:hypothetical protein